MREGGRSVAFILTGSARASYWPGRSLQRSSLPGGCSGGTLALLLGFAAGAVLASLANTVLPQAFDRADPYVALATVAGFLVAYVLSNSKGPRKNYCTVWRLQTVAIRRRRDRRYHQ